MTEPNQHRSSLAIWVLLLLVFILVAGFSLVAILFLWKTISHREARRQLNHIWVLSHAFAEKDGTLFAKRGPVIINDTAIQCPACRKPFVWKPRLKNGVAVRIRSGNRHFFVCCQEQHSYSEQRWFLFNDGTVRLLRDDQVDWDTNSEKGNE